MLSLHERPNGACIAESAKQPLKQVSELLETENMEHVQIYTTVLFCRFLACAAAFAGLQNTRLCRLENHFLDFLAMKLLIAAMPPLPLSF